MASTHTFRIKVSIYKLEGYRKLIEEKLILWGKNVQNLGFGLQLARQ